MGARARARVAVRASSPPADGRWPLPSARRPAGRVACSDLLRVRVRVRARARVRVRVRARARVRVRVRVRMAHARMLSGAEVQVVALERR